MNVYTTHVRTYLEDKVQYSQWNYDGSKDRHSNHDDNQCANGLKESEQEGAVRHWDELVDRVDVLGEAVEDPSQGSGVKEGHRGAKDVEEHLVVEDLRANDASSGQGECSKQDKHCLAQSKGCIDPQVVLSVKYIHVHAQNGST